MARPFHSVGVFIALIGWLGCSVNEDRMLPNHYALVAASKVLEAEQAYHVRRGSYGTLEQLQQDGDLDSQSFARLQSGATGYAFRLKVYEGGYLFGATAADAETGQSSRGRQTNKCSASL